MNKNGFQFSPVLPITLSKSMHIMLLRALHFLFSWPSIPGVCFTYQAGMQTLRDRVVHMKLIGDQWVRSGAWEFEKLSLFEKMFRNFSFASQKHVMRIQSLTSQEKIAPVEPQEQWEKPSKKQKKAYETWNHNEQDQGTRKSNEKKNVLRKLLERVEVFLLQTRPGSSLDDLTGWASCPEKTVCVCVVSEAHVVTVSRFAHGLHMARCEILFHFGDVSVIFLT